MNKSKNGALCKKNINPNLIKYRTFAGEKQGCSKKTRAEIIPLEPEQVMLLRELMMTDFSLVFYD